MNAKKLVLSAVVATACLTASIAMAGPRHAAGSASAFHAPMSRPAFSNRGSAYSANRFNGGLNNSRRIGVTSANRNGNWTRNGNWSGGNWHHRHHRFNNFVFVGGFYPYSWYYPYDYYPYDYGYYSYGQPAAYDGAGAYDGSLVAEVQGRLASAGYYRGPIDGVMGPQTRRAIRAYERARGLRVDGIIDERLLSTMDLR
jgi:putative peptidoglycan binding protein